MNRSVGIITQARMTSTRLPGKILKKASDVSLLEHHVNRLRWSELPIFIATTTNATDDIVVDFTNAQKLYYYRGSEDNVLSRYYECAKENKLDIIVRVTSDCPLIDGLSIKEAVKEYIEINDSNLYMSNSYKKTFPRGFDYEIFSFKALEEAYKNATDLSDLEHVTPYINKNKSGNIKILNQENVTDKSYIRITVDTIEDYTLVKILIEDYKAETKRYSDIIKIVDAHPELLKINEHIEQKKN